MGLWRFWPLDLRKGPVAASLLKLGAATEGVRSRSDATAGRQDASVIQLSGDCADACDALGLLYGQPHQPSSETSRLLRIVRTVDRMGAFKHMTKSHLKLVTPAT
jgi:hypothetical protein